MMPTIFATRNSSAARLRYMFFLPVVIHNPSHRDVSPCFATSSVSAAEIQRGGVKTTTCHRTSPHMHLQSYPNSLCRLLLTALLLRRKLRLLSAKQLRGPQQEGNYHTTQDRYLILRSKPNTHHVLRLNLSTYRCVWRGQGNKIQHSNYVSPLCVSASKNCE